MLASMFSAQFVRAGHLFKIMWDIAPKGLGLEEVLAHLITKMTSSDFKGSQSNHSLLFCRFWEPRRQGEGASEEQLMLVK